MCRALKAHFEKASGHPDVDPFPPNYDVEMGKLLAQIIVPYLGPDVMNPEVLDPRTNAGFVGNSRLTDAIMLQMWEELYASKQQF
jgi:hypothetical protein